MATSYQTPGVYVQEVAAFPNSIPLDVPTAVPAFIGYTQIAKKSVDDDLDFIPYLIHSLPEFEQYFGRMPGEKITVTIEDVVQKNGSQKRVAQRKTDASIHTFSPHIFWYQLQLFFQNGGTSCYIVSTGRPTGTIDAQDLLKGLQTLRNQAGITLLLFPEGCSLQDPAALYALYNAAMEQAAQMQDRFVLCDVSQQPVPEGTDVSYFRKLVTGGTADGLRYAAAYYPFLKTNIPVYYTDDSISIIHQEQVQEAGKADQFINGVLHGLTMADVQAKRTINIQSVIQQHLVTLPPTCAVAGLYNLVDNTRGVWNAPANASLVSVIAPTIKITDNNQGDLNMPVDGKSINAIRTFPGKGVLVWGARTLDGNSNDWRYIPVKRTCIMIETAVSSALQQFVFEPNDANTWIRVQSVINNYLTQLWMNGALQGSKPEEAFAVKIGLGTTMTDIDIEVGILRVQLMLAIVRPVEYLVLIFEQKMAVQ